MKKIIDGNKISFYEDEKEIMYMDFPCDEFAWVFMTNDEVTITCEDELYQALNNIMSQEYSFSPQEKIKNYKTGDELVWYSDRAFNPDDEWDVMSVSYLMIKRVDDTFKLKCTKPLYDIIDRKNKTHMICFSPGGNGNGSLNLKTNSTFQTDVVTMLYYPLIKESKRKIFPN